MKKGFKHITDCFFEYLGAVIMTAMLLVFIFVVNTYHYFIYALVITVFIFILKKTQRKGWRKKGEYFLILLGISYAFLLIFFSVSPFLRFKEFQWTHLSWNTTDAKIVFYQSGWDKPYRKSSGYAYSDITYSYKAGNHHFTRTEHKAEKLYYPVWENKKRIQKLKKEVLQKTRQRIDDKKFIVLYNPDHPSESRFFLSRQLFYPQGSGLYAFAVLIGVFFLIIASGIIFTCKK